MNKSLKFQLLLAPFSRVTPATLKAFKKEPLRMWQQDSLLDDFLIVLSTASKQSTSKH